METLDTVNESSASSLPEERVEAGKVLKVADMPDDERPREKALKYGIGSLTSAELFALILRTGTKGRPITDLCRDIMRVNDGKILNLERRDRRELEMIDGLGPVKAQQIEAVMEIVRRYRRESLGRRIIIRSSRDIYEMMSAEIANLPHEEFWVITLNRGNMVTGTKRCSEGGAAGTVFDVKKILKHCILLGAEGVIVCHNHPSGNMRPSGPDDSITRKMKEACAALDIRMFDHLIITTEGYYSYTDQGRL